MTEKKKICFYPLLASGPVNLSASIGSLLLNKYSNKIDVYFISDRKWYEKLSKIDPRFKFGIFDYEDKEQKKGLEHLVELLESSLKMNLVDKFKNMWKMFIQGESIYEIDEKSEIEIMKIKPDFLICDQVWHLPSMVNSGIPYAFLCSCNPLLLALDGFPIMGTDSRLDDKLGINKFKEQLEPFWMEMRQLLIDFFNKRNVQYNLNLRVDQPMSDHFTLYPCPQEVDYYSDELKEKYKLWQIDTNLHPGRIPKPFELPDEFAKLPGKIVYVSLGSLFSAYTHILQRLCDILEKLPYKYIVSKGPNGDKLKFPSNKFIGENFVNQLAVLQVVDAMIAHGGHNTFGECFHFGVPNIILPIQFDQINNAVRLEETGYGYSMDALNFTEEELTDKLSKILNNEELRMKWKKASERIQRENRMGPVVDRIVDYVYKL